MSENETADQTAAVDALYKAFDAIHGVHPVGDQSAPAAPDSSGSTPGYGERGESF